MRRALNRAYLRLQGKHPRRPRSLVGQLASLAADAVLTGAVLAALGGVVLIVLAVLDGFQLVQALGGVALVALAVLLLYVWEKLAWGPFLEGMSGLS